MRLEAVLAVLAPWTYVNVKAGARLLDQRCPGWATEAGYRGYPIDTARLDLAHGWYCVLGQLFGSYGHGLDVLGIRHSWRKYGFMSFCSWVATGLWIAEIESRRRTATMPAPAETRTALAVEDLSPA